VKQTKAQVTAERLRELLHYDPDTGLFTWLPRSPESFKNKQAFLAWNTRYLGMAAGRASGQCRYATIDIDGTVCYAHRLAYLYMTGSHAAGDIDHIDGDKKNNRWSNLRAVTRSVNLQNQRRSRGLTGFLGVDYFASRDQYRARIQVGNRQLNLGYFKSPEEAHQAYLKSKRELHEGCTL
jgi:hypothetical protein